MNFPIYKVASWANLRYAIPEMLQAILFLMFRLHRKKILLVFLLLTITSIFVQISSVPSPFTEWISRPQSVIWYPKQNIALLKGKGHSLALDAHLDTSPDTPVLATLNSSTRTFEPVPVFKKGSLRSRKGTGHNIKQGILRPPADTLFRVKKLPTHIEKYIRSLTPEEALAYAKKDIENTSLTNDDNDQELYPPLFRNISTFKRSYEWMERLLKVYIYQEGQKPIFHVPHLIGIYSSEGWFIRLMEGNKQFVTKDPKKAHLFFLPYSTRQLQTSLYIANSHDLKPLAIFLRNYVNMIAAKHPFWNRTSGTDHFLVACHDWGPYILKEHEELMRNTIKALCNADVSEKIFIAGRDVSLPETTIRNPKRPLRNVGGRRVSQRPILAFFAGRRHGRVRPLLLKHWSDKHEDMRIYGPLPNRASRVMSYPEHMKSSKYCICPMGYEVNSPRIVESIYYECVPVIIADNFVPPLSEILNWDAFSVTILEKDIPRLKEILVAIPMKRYLALQANVKRVQKHFFWNTKPVRYDLFHMILHSIWTSRLNHLQASDWR